MESDIGRERYGKSGEAVGNHTHTRNNYNFRICDCGVSRSDS